MIQLEPGEYMGIVRQLADPNDATTYYVRAVIRNARTDATIDTVDLTSRGLGRFSEEWQVISESSDAVYVSIVTYVYTDASYTTLSEVYGAEASTYLIEPRRLGSGGGGSGVSIQTIKKILGEMLEEWGGKIPRPEVLDYDRIDAIVRANVPNIPDVDMDHIATREDLCKCEEEAKERMRNIEEKMEKETREINLLLKKTIGEIETLPRDFPKVDLDPVFTAIDKKSFNLSDDEKLLKKIGDMTASAIAAIFHNAGVAGAPKGDENKPRSSVRTLIRNAVSKK